MADYSRFLFDAISGAGDPFVQNRERSQQLAQQQYANQIGEKRYSDALMQDERDFAFRQQEAQRSQANADRNYSLDRQRLDPEEVRLFRALKAEGYPGGFQDFLKERGKGAGSGELGLSPVYVRNPDGSVGIAQLGKGGQVHKPDLGEGVTVVNPFERAAMTAEGKKQGELAAALPGGIAAGERIIQGVDDALADPALGEVTGFVQGRLPARTSGQARAQSRIDQVLGGTFLQAYNDLRGGGQITEKEGEKAQAAYNRLGSQTMSDADYRAALQEFRDEVVKLMGIARERAGQGGGQARAPAGGGWSVQQVD